MGQQYSSEAKRIIQSLKEFDKEDFERWYDSHVNIVGGGHVLQYVATREESEEGVVD